LVLLEPHGWLLGAVVLDSLKHAPKPNVAKLSNAAKIIVRIDAIPLLNYGRSKPPKQ
jgi:hypothetical protein